MPLLQPARFFGHVPLPVPQKGQSFDPASHGLHWPILKMLALVPTYTPEQGMEQFLIQQLLLGVNDRVWTCMTSRT